MIDNYDSFTYIIVQYFEQLQQQVKIIRNDEYVIEDLIQDNHCSDFKLEDIQAIIIGPGPGRPENAGITLEVIRYFVGRIPIFGICLGHQAIAMAYGAHIVQAHEIMHGRLSAVYHHRSRVFLDLPCPVSMTRYHSLVVDKDTLPDVFEITAWTVPSKALVQQPQRDTISSPLIQKNRTQHMHLYHHTVNDIMGIRHRHLNLEGVQFHPESILSGSGLKLLNNFLLQHDLAIFSQADIDAGKHLQ